MIHGEPSGATLNSRMQWGLQTLQALPIIRRVLRKNPRPVTSPSKPQDVPPDNSSSLSPYIVLSSCLKLSF